MPFSECAPYPVSEFLFRLGDPSRPPICIPFFIIVAHPDDETIGIGAQLPRLKNATLIHLTDGAPPNMGDATRLGFPSAADYSRARYRELESVLARTGFSRAKSIRLGIPDQELALSLAQVTGELRSLFEISRPALVLTHPYEGGHPDHDAAAFCVHSAIELAALRIPVVEMAFYHLAGGQFVAGEFLPDSELPGISVQFNPAELALKQELFGRYRTQAQVLSAFRIGEERFRAAPNYDFTQAPSAGELNYDRQDLGVTGPQFVSLARGAIQELRLGKSK